MSHAPTDLLERRHAAVRERLSARGVAALVVTSLPNVLYLTNFKGSSAIIVLSADRLVFITDFRYVTSMDEARGTGWECRDLDLVRVGLDRWEMETVLSEFVAERRLRKV